MTSNSQKETHSRKTDVVFFSTCNFLVIHLKIHINKNKTNVFLLQINCEPNASTDLVFANILIYLQL